MPKYLNIWEIDTSKMPADPKERGPLLNKMLDMTKQMLKEKPGSQWGISLDGNMGFFLSSARGKWQDVAQSTLAFAPYVKSKIFQVMSAEEAEENLKSMAQPK